MDGDGDMDILSASFLTILTGMKITNLLGLKILQQVQMVHFCLCRNMDGDGDMDIIASALDNTIAGMKITARILLDRCQSQQMQLLQDLFKQNLWTGWGYGYRVGAIAWYENNGAANPVGLKLL